MAYYCAHCGSPNHQAMDCSHPELTYTPPPPEPSELQRHAAAQEQETQQAAKAEKNKLDPARWPHGPQICTKENRCAFKDEKEMGKFMSANASTAAKKWLCEACAYWHYIPSPQVDSNGQARAVLKPNFRPFMRDSMRQMSMNRTVRSGQNDLPQREIALEKSPKKIIDKKPKPAATSSSQKRNADELF